MLKAKTFDLKTTNMALFGTEIETNIKKAAAESEHSWDGCGQQVGIEIWRIEQFQVVPYPKEEYGTFFSGDSFIVLKTSEQNDKLVHDIHFWIGGCSTQDEYGTAAYKTVELDDLLDGEPVQHREIEGHESELFLSYFKEITFVDGGVETGFHHIEPETYEKRLLHCKGKSSGVVVRQVDAVASSVNSGDVFILDTGSKLYQFNGESSGPFEKNEAAKVCRALDDQRGSGVEINVFEQGDEDDAANAFWEELGGKGEIGEPTPDVVESNKALFSLADDTFTPVDDISEDSLDSGNVYLFDGGFEVFLWMGKDATSHEKKSSISLATKYLFEFDRPLHLPLTSLVEGGENESFKQAIAA